MSEIAGVMQNTLAKLSWCPGKQLHSNAERSGGQEMGIVLDTSFFPDSIDPLCCDSQASGLPCRESYRAARAPGASPWLSEGTRQPNAWGRGMAGAGVEPRRVREIRPRCCPQTCRWLPGSLGQTPHLAGLWISWPQRGIATPALRK